MPNTDWVALARAALGQQGELQVTASGRRVLRCGELTVFADESTGHPVASMRQGSSIVFAVVRPDGRLDWVDRRPLMHAVRSGSR